MPNGAPGAAGMAAAAAAAAIAQAIKASGAIVRLEPEQFASILSRADAPLVVAAEGGFLSTTYQYLTSYKGLVFYTKGKMPLELSRNVELIAAKKIWIPS